MGKGTNTTTTSTAPNAAASSAYYDLLNRAGGVASTPYQAYGGDLTAPINAQQSAGISNINQGAGFASPYIQEAAGFARSAAQPLSAADIQRYQSPYTQQVVDSTTNWFNNQNQQQQQNVIGNAAAAGALGGDRVGVAQANLAAQQTASQAPVIAGLYNQGYTQALGVAQQQQQNRGNAAYSLGNLGVSGQNAALSGANAQLGAGNLQQQNEQQRLNALYQQYQIAQAFPYQQTQWLAGVDTGVGSQLGGTSSTTAPPPNPWAQVAGVGLTAASMFLNRGGRIKGFAPGGGVGEGPFAGVGWIPTRGITMGRGAPPAPGVAPQQAAAFKPMDFKGKFGGESLGGAPLDITSEGGGFMPSGVGSVFPMGSSPVRSSQDAIYRDGGGVPGFAEGGAPDFDDRWAPVPEAIETGLFDPQGVNSMTATPVRTERILPTISDAGPSVPMPRARPEEAPQGVAALRPDDVPWPIRPPAGAPESEDEALALASRNETRNESFPDAPPPGVAAPQGEGAQRRGGFGLGLIPENMRMPLMTAGLAMLASRSPNLGNAIGEGGIAGVGAYSQQKQAELLHAEKQQDLGLKSRHMDNETKRLDQAATQARAALAETTRYHSGMLDRENNKMIGVNEDGYPVYQDTRTGKETVGTVKLQGREKNKMIGVNEDGFPVYVDERTGKESIGETKLQGKAPPGYIRNPDGTMAAIKGGPADPEHIKEVTKAKTTGGTLPDDTADWLAERVIAGDARALTNLGRGAQGAENIIKIQTLAARKAADRGMNPNDILAKVAEQSGLTAQQRTFGTQVARMAVNSTEAEGAIDLGRTASAAVPRGNWVPVTKAIQAFQSGTSDPKLAAFGAANLAIINTYSRAISPTGVPTVHDKEEAQRLLSTATGPDAYNAVLDQMKKEIAIAHAAPTKAKEEMERIRKGGPAAEAAAPPAPKAGDRARFRGADGKPVWGVFDGKIWAPEKP